MVLALFVGGTAFAIPGVAGKAAALTGCSRTVGAGGSLQYAIDHTPSGGTLCLTGNVRATSTVRVTRSNITINGRGYRLTVAGYHVGLELRCVSNIVVRSLKIVGTNPRPGVWVHAQEHGHGIAVYGGKNFTFSWVSMWNIQGDGFYLSACGDKWADTVRIRNSSVTSNARHGIGIVAARHVRAEGMHYRNIALHLVSVEPDWNSSFAQGATDITLVTATSTGWVGRDESGTTGTTAVYIGTPYGAQSGEYAPIIARVTVSGMRVIDSKYGIWSSVTASGGYRMSSIVFTGNRGANRWSTASHGVITCQDTDGFSVTNNSQAVTYGEGMYMARSMGCSDASASGNVGSGLAGQLHD